MSKAGIIALLLLGAVLAFCAWHDRRCRRRIREWADRSGYAILKLHYERRFLVCLFLAKGGWRVTIQDAEGGRRQGLVHFGHWLFDLPWGQMQVEWR